MSPAPRVVVTPSSSRCSVQTASTSRQRTAMVVGCSVRNVVERRGTKPVSSSSTPSAAKGGANGLAALPAASSASTRWIAVSCAWRRAHMASGDGAGRKRPALEVGRGGAERGDERGAAPAQPVGQLGVLRSRCPRSRPGPGRPASVRRSTTKPVAQRCTPPMCRTRSRTAQSGQVGTAAPGSASRHGLRHPLALLAQRVDVGGDLHAGPPPAQLTLSRSMTKTRVSLGAIPAPGDDAP